MVKFPYKQRQRRFLNSQVLVELELNGNDSSTNFLRVVKLILEKFKNLEFTRNRAYIIFDELELSVNEKGAPT